MIASTSKPYTEIFLEVDKLTETSEILDFSCSNNSDNSPQMTIFSPFELDQES